MVELQWFYQISKRSQSSYPHDRPHARTGGRLVCWEGRYRHWHQIANDRHKFGSLFLQPLGSESVHTAEPSDTEAGLRLAERVVLSA